MLQEIVQQFFPGCHAEQIVPFGKGHINTTYKVDLAGNGHSYILQRINTGVFKYPEGIANTHLRLQNEVFDSEHVIEIAELILTKDGRKLFQDNNHGVWRMTSFIKDSYTIEVIADSWQAAEAGKAYGMFAHICDKLDPKTFQEAIASFHSLSFRLEQLDEAIRNDASGRLAAVQDVVDFFKTRQTSVSQIETLVNNGKIPMRVVHNDTKINNLLFRVDKATAVIDLDTVGPGILYYDYGDALRTSASTAKEDEKDTDKMDFNLDYFAAFTREYLGQVKDIISPDEGKYFHLAPVLMTYIIGIRFLTDYLNGDVYYKTAYSDHNLVRCKTQKKLITRMEDKKDEMIQIVYEALTLPVG